jgi:hypothetical protein
LCRYTASQGLRPELLNDQSVALSPDVLAHIDRTTSKTVRFLDTGAGKPVGEEITHALEVGALYKLNPVEKPNHSLKAPGFNPWT